MKLKFYYFLLSALLFHQAAFSENARSDENLNNICYSTIGINIVKNFTKSIVANFENVDHISHGFSCGQDGNRIKNFVRIDKEEETILRKFINDDKNFSHINEHVEDVKFRDKISNVHKQGIELTDGVSYVRMYVTPDGKHCVFLNCSGISSPLWACSEELSVHLRLILKKLATNN